jgi:hypothetical protein
VPPERADQGTIPLNGPVDGIVAGNDGRGDVEHLRAEAPPGVEDGVVEGTSEGVLAVGGDAVGDDAPLLETACTGRRVGLECGLSLGGVEQSCDSKVVGMSSVPVIPLCPFLFSLLPHHAPPSSIVLDCTGKRRRVDARMSLTKVTPATKEPIAKSALELQDQRIDGQCASSRLSPDRPGKRRSWKQTCHGRGDTDSPCLPTLPPPPPRRA